MENPYKFIHVPINYNKYKLTYKNGRKAIYIQFDNVFKKKSCMIKLYIPIKIIIQFNQF